MQEGDAPAPGPAARVLIDEPVAGGPATLERLVEIGHAVADVMDPRAAPGEELRHGARGVAGLEQLDLHVAQRERSEEHTSELQSHSDLVCRLLLEKKKQIK